MVDTNFNHFLITWFNLRGVGTEVSSDEWISWNNYRFDFFRQYTLPSVLNQSNKNFRWLIYFDITTPAEIREKMEILNNIPLIQAVFEKGIEGFRNNYLNTVKSQIHHNKKPWLITSRMDSDDALHKDAINSVQQHFLPGDGQIISLASGYTFDMKLRKMSHYYYFKSPFLSLIEKTDSPQLKGIYYYDHTLWPGIEFSLIRELKAMFGNRIAQKPVYILDRPYWIQFIHNNISNSFYRGFPVSRSVNLKDFGLELKNEREPWYNFYKFYSYWRWKRYFKARVYLLFLKVYAFFIRMF